MSKKKTQSAAVKSRWPKRLLRRTGSLCKWALRLGLFVIMLAFLAGAGLWVTALKMFNAQQISEALADRLQTLFDRPVVISSLDLKFLNTVELKGFAVLDDQVRPGEPFLSAEFVLIRYKVLPLLENKLIIDEVTLQRPRIQIVRDETGTYNTPPVRTAVAQETHISGLHGERLQVSVEDWRIRDGVLSYKDLGAGVSHAVYGLNVHFSHLRFNELSRFRLETVLRNRWKDNISDLEIRGTGQINFADFDWSKFALRNFKTQVALFRKPVRLTVDIDNLRTPFFTVQAEAPAFDQQDLSVFQKDLPVFQVPGSRWTAQGRLEAGYTQLHLDELSGKTKNMTLSVLGTLDFAAAKPLAFSLQAKTGWGDLAVLSKNWPALARFRLTGQGQASAELVREEGHFSLPVAQINTKQLSGNFWGFETAGLSGSLVIKKNGTDFYAATTDGRVTIKETVFDKLKLTGSYRKGNVYAYIGSGTLDGVPLKMRLSIDRIKSPRREINTSIYLKHFEPMPFIRVVHDFADVIMAIPKTKHKFSPAQNGDLAWLRNFRDRLPRFMPNFSGTLYADTFASTVLSGRDFNAEFAFTGLLPGAAKLNGTLDVELKDGVIHQMEKLAEEQQALNITFTPFIMMHRMERSGSFKVGEVLKDVAFNEMAASVDFKNGTMIINNAYTQGPVISAAVSGWTDWVRETFELVIWTMFTPSSKAGLLAENLTDESGNPALAFKVSSSMLKPRLEMLRAKKTGVQIDAARRRGLRTEFTKSRTFLKGEFNAKK